MNTVIEHTKHGSIKPFALPDWMMSNGVIGITTEEAAHLFGTKLEDVPSRIATLRKQSKMVSPARGFWIVVPPDKRSDCAPDIKSYIEALAAFLETKYCLGWLSAASLYGASHHAAQVTQIAVDRNVDNRKVGNQKLEFYKRDFLKNITVETKTYPTGRLNVASVGTTALMVCADTLICGGSDNVVNIIIELAELNDGLIENALENVHLFSASAVRRLGWVLDTFSQINTDDIKKYCDSLTVDTSLLSPTDGKVGKIDKKWNLVLNRKVEPDIC